MGDAALAACFQDGGAALELDALAIAIGDHDGVAPAQIIAQIPGAQDDEDKQGVAQQEPASGGVERGGLCCAGEMDGGLGLLEPARLPVEIGDLASGLHESQQGQDRNQQGGSEKIGLGRGIPGLQAQPAPKPDAAVKPGGKQRQDLQQSLEGSEDPDHQQDIVVVVLGAEPGIGQPGSDHMDEDQGRDDEAQEDLGPIAAAEAAEASALEQRPERQEEMGQDRAIEENGAQRVAPDGQEDLAAFGQRGVGDQPHGMIQEMARHIGEEDKAAREPDAPQVHRPLHGRPVINAMAAKLSGRLACDNRPAMADCKTDD